MVVGLLCSPQGGQLYSCFIVIGSAEQSLPCRSWAPDGRGKDREWSHLDLSICSAEAVYCLMFGWLGLAAAAEWMRIGLHRWGDVVVGHRWLLIRKSYGCQMYWLSLSESWWWLAVEPIDLGSEGRKLDL